jgi:hypothetical protein
LKPSKRITPPPFKLVPWASDNFWPIARPPFSWHQLGPARELRYPVVFIRPQQWGPGHWLGVAERGPCRLDRGKSKKQALPIRRDFFFSESRTHDPYPPTLSLRSERRHLRSGGGGLLLGLRLPRKGRALSVVVGLPFSSGRYPAKFRLSDRNVGETPSGEGCSGPIFVCSRIASKRLGSDRPVL